MLGLKFDCRNVLFDCSRIGRKNRDSPALFFFFTCLLSLSLSPVLLFHLLSVGQKKQGCPFFIFLFFFFSLFFTAFSSLPFVCSRPGKKIENAQNIFSLPPSLFLSFVFFLYLLSFSSPLFLPSSFSLALYSLGQRKDGRSSNFVSSVISTIFIFS